MPPRFDSEPNGTIELKPANLRRIPRPVINTNREQTSKTDGSGFGRGLAELFNNLANRNAGTEMKLRSLAHQQYQQNAAGLPTGSTEFAFAIHSIVVKPVIGTVAAIMGATSGLVNSELQQKSAIAKLEKAAVVHGCRLNDVEERILPFVEAQRLQVDRERQQLSLITQGLVRQGLLTISQRTGNLMVVAPDDETEEEIFRMMEHRGEIEAKWQRMTSEDIETPFIRRTQTFVGVAKTEAQRVGILPAQIDDAVRMGTETGAKIFREHRNKGRA